MSEDKEGVLTVPDAETYHLLKHKMGFSDNVIAAALIINEIRKLRLLLQKKWSMTV